MITESTFINYRPVIESAHSGDQGGSQGGIQAGFVSASEIEVMKVQLTKSFVEISSLRDQLTALKLTALRCHDLEKEVTAFIRMKSTIFLMTAMGINILYRY